MKLFLKLQEDEEWKVFKEEKKDYTGLKIQNLNIQDFDDSDKNDRDNDAEAVDSDQHNPNSLKKGPWKVVESIEQVQQGKSCWLNHILWFFIILFPITHLSFSLK